MKIINEPRHQDFNGKVHRTQKECINTENNFVGNVFQMLKDLKKGCKNHGNTCMGCPFNNDLYARCSIKEKTGKMPEDWNIEEGE